MNHNFFLVKIISKPEQSFFKEEKALTEVMVKYIPISKKSNCIDTFNLSIWGTLSYDIVKYYNINDYILVEGFISIRNNNLKNKIFIKNKQIDLSVLKVYPFLFN